MAAHKTVVLRRAARVGANLALQPARQQGVGLQGAECGLQHGQIFGVGVAAQQQAVAMGRLQQLGNAVAGVAQANDGAHGQQARQARQQGGGMHGGHLARGHLASLLARGNA